MMPTVTESFNPRLEAMQPSATLAMTARAAERRRAGHPVIGLSAGEPDFDTPAPVREAAIAAIREGFTHYTDNKGTPELRDAIARKLLADNGLEYDPGQIICSNGAKQSVMQAVTVLCRPGDEVVIPAPYWVSYPEMVRFSGGNPIVVTTGVASDWKMSPEQLEAAITDRTRLVILCSPSNPTGSVYTRSEMAALVEVLERHEHVYVISDEIYEHLVYGVEHVSIASWASIKDRTITVNGFSKAWAMTGWRLGYMAARPDIVQAASKLQGQYTSGPCSISQRAGIAALNMSSGPIDEMVKAFRHRRDVTLAGLRTIPDLVCPEPEGAFYLFPDVGAYLGARTEEGTVVDSTEALCFYLLEAYDVALVPGSAFGGHRGIRLSYAASLENLGTAVERMVRAFDALDHA